MPAGLFEWLACPSVPSALTGRAPMAVTPRLRWGSFLNSSKLPCLMNSSLTAHRNWAYGLHGFASYSPHRSTGSYETYFSSPPRSKARFTVWPQTHSSPAKARQPDRTEYQSSLPGLTQTMTCSTEQGAYGRWQDMDQWEKCNGLTHMKISQAHSSFSTSCPPQARAQCSSETNHLQFTKELPNQIFWSDEVTGFWTHPEILPSHHVSIHPPGNDFKQTYKNLYLCVRCLRCVRNDPRNRAGSCERLSQTN